MRFFRACLVSFVLAAGPALPAAGLQEPTGWDVSIRHLRGAVYLISGTSAEGRVNLVASIGSDGVLLSDTGTADMSRGILAVLVETAGGTADIVHVVNTHYHGDHTGGNAAVGAAAAIAAHPRTIESLESGAQFGPGPLEPSALPSVAVGDSSTLRFNGEEVRIVHVPRAHTDGDLAVHFLGSDVLHVGDIVLARGSLPYTRFPREFSLAVASLADRAGAGTIVGPGPGEPLDRAALSALAEIVRSSVEFVDREVGSGASLEEMLARRPGSWGVWDSRYLAVDDWLARLYEEAREPAGPTEDGGAGPLLAVVLRSAHELVLVDPQTLEPIRRFSTGRGPHEVAIASPGVAFVPNYGTHPVPHSGPIEPSELRWVEETGNTLSRIDLGNGGTQVVDLGECTNPHGVAAAPDGSAVWVTCQDIRQVWEIDTGSGEIRNRWSTDQETSHIALASPDGEKVYIANIGSGSVSVLDRTTGRVRTIEAEPGAEGMAISPDGRRLWVANNQSHSITVIDAEADEPLETFESAGRFPIKLAFSPDGSAVWVANNQSRDVTVYDARTREVLRTIDLGSSPLGLLAAPDGRVFVTLPRLNEVVVLDGTAEGAIVGRFSPGIEPDGMAWIPRVTLSPHDPSSAPTR